VINIKKFLLLSILIVLGTVSCAGWTKPYFRQDFFERDRKERSDSHAFADEKKSYRIVDVAHRGGAAYAPENTMAAFMNGFKLKADFLELDVAMTKDGVPIVIHDDTVNRTTNGTGKVVDLTYDYISMLDAGSWFSPQFAGEHVPTLGEVLDTFWGKIGILIEIKNPKIYPGIEQKVADELTIRNMDKPENGEIIVQSFDWNAVKTFHKILPEVPVGVLTFYAIDVTPARLAEAATYANYVNPYWATLNFLPYVVQITPDVIDLVHDYGMGIIVWTVNTRVDIAWLVKSRVDGIITDNPDYVPTKR
jgi:glycerophosphoryl diester phosphodiesterase